MDPAIKAFSYLLAATSQSAGVLYVCYLSIPYLQQRYPGFKSWFWVMMSVGLVASAYSFYLVVKSLVNDMKD